MSAVERCEWATCRDKGRPRPDGWTFCDAHAGEAVWAETPDRPSAQGRASQRHGTVEGIAWHHLRAEKLCAKCRDRHDQVVADRTAKDRRRKRVRT